MQVNLNSTTWKWLLKLNYWHWDCSIPTLDRKKAEFLWKSVLSNGIKREFLTNSPLNDGFHLPISTEAKFICIIQRYSLSYILHKVTNTYTQFSTHEINAIRYFSMFTANRFFYQTVLSNHSFPFFHFFKLPFSPDLLPLRFPSAKSKSLRDNNQTQQDTVRQGDSPHTMSRQSNTTEGNYPKIRQKCLRHTHSHY